MDHGLFRPQLGHFAANYRVISWDVPLHGRSRPYVGFTLQRAATEMVRILDAEAISKAHLVGQSMGGFIIQLVAVNHPDRAWTLTAVDSSPVQPSYYSALDRRLLSVAPRLLRLYPYETLIKSIATRIALTEPAQAYALDTLKGLTKAEIADIMEKVYLGLAKVDGESRLAAPLLIVYGEYDRTGKVVSYSRRWAEREQRVLQIVPDAAHNANMDNPAAFNRFLADFLKIAPSI
jgi:pimeloyl-ACP methyl ester carboxylesterase